MPLKCLTHKYYNIKQKYSQENIREKQILVQ